MAAPSITSSAGWLQPTIKADNTRGQAPIDRIWNRFDGMYPGKFRSSFPDDKAIQNWREAWAAGFDAVSLTMEEAAAGLSACLAYDGWPPSLPEFLKLCRPPINPESAYYEAVEQMRRRWSSLEAERQREAWSHPAIYWAAAAFGGELGQHSYATQKGRWCALLEAALKDHADGRRTSVPKRAEALPQPDLSITPEQRAANIEKLKKELGMVTGSVSGNEQNEQERKAALDRIDQALAERSEDSTP